MLKIHFLNVGHGDCTIIRHPSGRLTVIDINNSQNYDAESFEELLAEEKVLRRYANDGSAREAAGAREKGELTDPIAFLKTTYPGEKPFRFILTHPDMDHMRGLKNLYDEVGFTNFWDTGNTKPTPTFKSDADKDDWNFYQNLRAGSVDGLKPKYFDRGDRAYAFGKDEQGRDGGDKMEILSPTPDLVALCNKASKSNDLSLVIRVSHAGKSIILPGDAEKDAWDSMQATYGKKLKSTYLKASHHGRDSGYHLESLKLIDPEMTFVSVGRKPSTDASSKYRNYSGRVVSTRYHGNLHLVISPDGTSKIIADKNPD